LDGSKNAMYVQAGRSVSRSRVTEHATARVEQRPAASVPPQFATVPVTEPVPVPVPVPIQEPVRVESVPVPAQMPAPVPVPVREPVRVESAPVPVREPAPVPVREPVPIPVRRVESVTAEIELTLPPLPVLPVITPPVSEGAECGSLAMVFATMQEWRNLYEPEHGFSRGTIFEELDLPFMGEGACRRE